MHLDDVLRTYLIQLRANGRSAHTIAQYQRHVGLLATWTRDVGHCGEASALRPEDLAAFLASDKARLRADGAEKKPGSMNALRSSVRSFFRYLSDAGYIAEDPARLVRRAHCTPGPPRAITDSEIVRLRSAVGEGAGTAARRDEVLFEFLLATGLRIGAALSLEVGDLDLQARVAWVRKSKGGQSLKVHLTPALAERLDDWLDGRSSGLLFGICARQAQKRLAMWIERAAIRSGLTLHSFRHAFAIRLYQKTGDLLLVREALHHRAIASTLVYARCDEERVRRAMGA